jgi:hypothetical protein
MRRRATRCNLCIYEKAAPSFLRRTPSFLIAPHAMWPLIDLLKINDPQNVCAI